MMLPVGEKSTGEWLYNLIKDNILTVLLSIITDSASNLTGPPWEKT